MSRKRPGDRPRRAAPQTEMKSRDGAGTPREGRAQNLVVQLLIVGLAAILLFWNLDWRYLWQDEAATVRAALSDALGDEIFRRAPVNADTILTSLEAGRPMQHPLMAHI